MATLRTDALLLRAVDVGESDRIVHLLTPATGRLVAIAKGARRSVKRFPGTLDLFNQLALQVDLRRPTQLAWLEQARLIQAFEGIRANPLRFALGCYLTELLDRLAPEGGAPADVERLFAFALDALRWLDGAAPDTRLRVLLELRALDALGLRPQLRVCVRCGREVEARDGRVAFHIGEGGPLCSRCEPERARFAVHLGTLRALEQGLQMELAHIDRLALGGQALREARELLRLFLRYHVGLELRSEPFLSEQLTLPEGKGTLRSPGPRP